MGEANESPLEGAQRELAEEVGLIAGTWESLGTGYSSATLTARWHVYLATQLTPASGFQKDGAEHDLIARRVRFGTAVDAAMDGQIEHGMSVAALLRAARRLGI